MFSSRFNLTVLFKSSEKETEEIEVRIFLTERFDIYESTEKTICQRSLDERVETTIRGIEFKHLRSKFIGELELEECQRLMSK